MAPITIPSRTPITTAIINPVTKRAVHPSIKVKAKLGPVGSFHSYQELDTSLSQEVKEGDRLRLRKGCTNVTDYFLL